MRLQWKLADMFSGVQPLASAVARLAVAAQAGGPAAARDEAARIEPETVRCHDCGHKFPLKAGMRLDHPPARLVQAEAERNRMQGYVIECPACHKDHFVGWRQ